MLWRMEKVRAPALDYLPLVKTSRSVVGSGDTSAAVHHD